MFVRSDDQVCRQKVVKVIRESTGEEISFCVLADDDEGYYEQYVRLSDGTFLTRDDGSIVTKTVIESIKIEICDRPLPKPGYTYDVE